MIGPGTGVRFYLVCGVTDMRKGIARFLALTQDGAMRLTSAQLSQLWEGIDWRRPDWGAPPARGG